jgi:putative ABC transport system permease protein
MRYSPWDYKDPIRPMYWISEAQTTHYDDPDYQAGEIWSHYLYNIEIWAPGNPPGIEEKVRKALASVDPDLVLYGTDSYDKVVHGDFQQEDMIATLTTLFGALGLVLSAVGLYGVMAYMVEQRTGEIGVRVALRRAFSQVAIGAGKLMTQQLFSVRPWDPVMLASATLVLGLAALLASALPAWRAAGVEPMLALRNE